MFYWALVARLFLPLRLLWVPAVDTEPPFKTSGGKNMRSPSLISNSSKWTLLISCTLTHPFSSNKIFYIRSIPWYPPWKPLKLLWLLYRLRYSSAFKIWKLVSIKKSSERFVFSAWLVQYRSESDRLYDSLITYILFSIFVFCSVKYLPLILSKFVWLG